MMRVMAAPTARRGWRSFLLALVSVLTVAPSAHGAVADRTASLDNGGLARFDQLNTSAGALAVVRRTAYDGRRAARASITGGANGYSRGLFNVDWNDGDEVWYSAAFRLPRGFVRRMQGEVDLLRWDNWPTDPETTDRGGIVIWHGDGRARLIRQKLGVEQVPLGARFRLPEGRWFLLEVHQRLSRGGGALSEVFLDGRRVAVSRAPNTYGRGVQRLRAGIVAIDAVKQRRPLSLLFDSVGIRGDGSRWPALRQARSSS